MKLKELRHYQVMKEMRKLLLDSVKDVGVSIQSTELIKPLEKNLKMMSLFIPGDYFITRAI